MTASNQEPTILDYAAQLIAGTSAILAMSFGGDPTASNRTGFYGDLTAAAEKVAMMVGGQTGPVWTRSGSLVNQTIVGVYSSTDPSSTGGGQFTAWNDVATHYVEMVQGGSAVAGFADAGGTIPYADLSLVSSGRTDLAIAAAFTGKSVYIIGGGAKVAKYATAAITYYVALTGTTITATTGFVGGTGAFTTGAFSGQITSTLADGTAPFVVTSTTRVSNLNVARAALADSVTTNANLTGPITSVGNATAVAAQTGTGTTFVMQASPTLTTPNIGAATGTSLLASGDLVGATVQGGTGSSSAPSWSFSTATTSGVYLASAGTGVMHLTSAGVDHARLSATASVFSHNGSVVLNTTPIASQGSGYFTFHLPDATAGGYAATGYGASAGITIRRANGTAAALTAMVLDDAIRTDQISGYQSTTPSFSALRTNYIVAASEGWTLTSQGFYHAWYANNTSTATPTEKMRLIQGNLLIGTTTDGMTAAGSLAIAQDLAHRGTKLGLFNTAPIAQKTGYGTPTGNSYQASFAAGSITLPNLAAAVAQLILDLKAYGQIGA